MATNQKKPAVTVHDLASPPKDKTARFFLFERYSKQKPTPEAIPFCDVRSLTLISLSSSARHTRYENWGRSLVRRCPIY